MVEGMPYRMPEQWAERPVYGYYPAPSPEYHGAHDLAPATNAHSDPFVEWPKIFGDSVPPPRLAPDLSNLPEVLEQIKMMKGLGQK